MTSFMFKNGNRRIARLVIYRLGAGVLIMVLGQVLANLPSQDWLTQEQIKIFCFIGGTILTVAKGVEFFFDKTINMFKNHEITDDPEPPNPNDR